MAELRYIDPDGRLRSVALGAEPCIVGRVASCQITFVDDMISREHMRIDREADGRFRIRDLGSRNKTYVNGQLAPETMLCPGDIIRVGDHVMEYVDDGVGSPEANLDFLTPDRKDPPPLEWIKAKTPVQLTTEQLGLLSWLSAGMALTSRPEDVADAALARLVGDLHADRGFIALRGEAKRELRPVAQRGLTKPATGDLMPVSETCVYSCVLQRVSGRYPTHAKEIDPKSGYAAAAMVAPLVFQGDIVGLIYVDRPTAKQPFSAIALQHLIAAGAQLGALMGEATHRLSESVARQSMAWLSSLRRTQHALTPRPQDIEGFESAIKCLPGHLRCGDLCDLIALDEQRCCAIVLDAGGQGVTGMAQAAGILAAVRTALSTSADLDELGAIMSAINRTVAGQKSRQLVQCVVVGLDRTTGLVSYVNAGGPPPLLMSGPARLVTLDHTSLLLGIDADFSYEVSVVDLPADFRLIAHSDGVVDIVDAGGEAWGTQRMHEVLLLREAFATPPEVIDTIAGAMNDHAAGHVRDDDASLVVVGP